MALSYQRLLEIQREIYRLPRGPGRFREYLRIMLTPDGQDMQLPLGMMNPMAKEHVPAFLDQLLSVDAEETAAQAVASIGVKLQQDFKIGLVVADDLLGGWTHRAAADYAHRFENDGQRKRGWLTGILWVTEPPTAETGRVAVLTSIFREIYQQIHGLARTLEEKMRQEGGVMAQAGCVGPMLSDDNLAYTSEVVAPLMDSTDKRTQIEVLYGDAGCAALGFTPRGLSQNAGLALALALGQKKWGGSMMAGETAPWRGGNVE